MALNGSKDLNKIIPKILSSREKPYPVYEYKHKSEKYQRYVYYESLDGFEYWHGVVAGIYCYIKRSGSPTIYGFNYYSNSEDKCAKEVYKVLKKYLRRITRENKKYDNKKYRRHINWQKWIDNYESLNPIS